jgi:hypothetical protein
MRPILISPLLLALVAPAAHAQITQRPEVTAAAKSVRG